MKLEKTFICPKEAARRTGFSISALEKGRAEFGNVRPPFYRIGRKILYEVGELLEWMQLHAVKPRQSPK
jgi:hypothetical protein